MQHLRHADVLGVGELAEHLPGNVVARYRGADDLVVGIRLGYCFAGHRQAERLAADEIGV